MFLLPMQKLATAFPRSTFSDLSTTPLHQVHQPVGEELGMDPQVLLVSQVGEDGVGDAPVSHLEGVPVLHQPGDVFTHPLRNLIGSLLLVFQQGLVPRDQEITFSRCRKPSPWVLGMWRLTWATTISAPSTAAFVIHAYAQAQVSGGIGGRGLHHRHVQGDEALREELGDLGEEDGSVIGLPLVDGLSEAGAHEEGVGSEVVPELGLGVGRNPQLPDLEDLCPEEGLGAGFYPFNEGIEEVLGLPAPGAHEDPAPPADLPDLLLRDELLRIPPLPLLHGAPLSSNGKKFWLSVSALWGK